jgi:DNA polymerase alpha subunit A
MLELFILKRKIRGPCWLNIKNVQLIGNVNDYRATWFKQECFINDPKYVDCSRLEDINRPSPPLTSITLSIKTTRSIDNTNEIALISFQINDNVNQDGPTGK